MNSIQFPRAVHEIQMHTHTLTPRHKILRSFSHSHRTTALCSVCTWLLYTVHTLVYTSVRNQGQKSHVINCDVKSSKHTVSRPAHSTISIHAQMILWSYTSHIHCIIAQRTLHIVFNLFFLCFQWIKRNKSEQSDFQTASNHKISLKLVLSIRWINNKPYYIYEFKWIHWEIHWKISRKKFQLSLVNRKFHWNIPTTTHFFLLFSK